MSLEMKNEISLQNPILTKSEGDDSSEPNNPNSENDKKSKYKR